MESRIRVNSLGKIARGRRNDYFFNLSYGDGKTIGDHAAAEVWSEDYVAVWHLSDNNSKNTIVDSVRGLRGEISGDASRVSGKIGKSILFDSDDTITIEKSKVFDITEDVTLEAWVTTQSRAKSYRYVINKSNKGQGVSPYSLCTHYFANDLPVFSVRVGARNGVGLSAMGAKELPLSKWTHLVGVRRYSQPFQRYSIHEIFVDGQRVPRKKPETFKSEAAMVKNSEPVEIGRGHVGSIDEIRISKRAHSRNWVHAQYLSMSDQLLTYRALVEADTDE